MIADPPESYLKTKLILPPLRGKRVLRGRLLEQLDGVFCVPLTLVCAPAGYGKTTLLVDWAHRCPAPVVWLTLDAGENDAPRFLNYLILTLQLLYPELGKSAQVTLNLPGADTFESSLRLLINDLAGLSEPTVLVLDDYHWIESEPVHQTLAYLIDHLPPNLHLILSSRVEPPIRLARLRARSAVLELRALDLSFQQAEIEYFLKQVMELNLPDQECRQLAQQTEGWAAGLQLAALSLRSGERSITADVFGSGQHYIFDYLAEEVLRHLSPATQHFLLSTSILNQMSGPLCEALVEPFPPYRSGSECLDALEHANLFTRALDGEHRWYRYHALFADFLRDHLQQSEPGSVLRLHRQAAAWLIAQGRFEEAYPHALAGGDLEQVIALVEGCAEIFEKQGDLITLEHWVQALPEAVVRSRPRISLARAWVAIAGLDYRQATLYLDLVESQFSSESDPALRGEMLAARAFLAGLRDQPEIALDYTRQAFALLPNEQHFLYGLLKLNLCFPQMLSGHLFQAIQTLEEAIFLAQRSESLLIALLAMRILGEAYLLVGRLSQAERVFQQALTLIESRLGKNSLLIGMAWLGLGEVCRQRNQFELARQYLENGLEKTMSWMPAIAMDGFMWLAHLEQASGRPVEAQALIRRARQVSEAHALPLLDDWWIPITAVRMDILQGYLEEALRWARTTGVDLEGLSNLANFNPDTPAYFRTNVLATLARLFLVLGRREQVPGALDKAARILEYILPLSAETGEYANLIEALLLLTQVEQALRHPQKAQDYLHRALDLGAPEHPIRVFLDEGQPLLDILAERRALNLPPVERAYLEELWAAWQAENGQPTPAPATHPVWIDPLSYREIEVLRYLAAGKSNQEIAAGLVLSLNTVKKHVSTIMAKLDAKNRTQAVLLARQQNII
jgi:LuxR family maltose regulon positive regulatory protein